MGCGVSRPVIEDDAPVPTGLSPIRRRIEEIKRQRRTHKRSKSHLSSRELLEDDDRMTSNADDEHYEDNGGQKTPLESIKEGEQGGNPFVEKPEKVEKVEVVVRLPPQPQLIENIGGNPLVEKAILAVKRYEEEEQRGDHHEKQYQDEEEDLDTDDEAQWDYGSDIGPGSPSFREYCMFTPDHSADHSADSDDVPKDDGKNDGDKVEERRQTEDSVGSSEGSGNVLVKKPHRGRKFKRVLPKGGQAAMKNLLNVKSCYTPPCSSHHHSHSHSSARLVAPSTTG